MKIKTLFLFALISSNLFAQSEFENFINLFPKHEWYELDSVIDLFRQKAIIIDTISPTLANKNMWGEHNDIQRPTRYRTYTTPAPHIRVDSNQYLKYHGGIHGKYSSDSNHDNLIAPLARVEFGDDIVMIVLFYKVFDPDLGTIDGYRYFKEAYTFRRNDEQMLSAINLTGYPIDALILEQDTTVVSYEYYPDPEDTDPVPNELVCKVVYKLDKDGYFHQISFETSQQEGNYFLGRVQDADGYTNVREAPNVKSEVLYQVPSGISTVSVEKIPNTNWGKVVICVIKRDEAITYKQGGYIHLSRVK